MLRKAFGICSKARSDDNTASINLSSGGPRKELDQRRTCGGCANTRSGHEGKRDKPACRGGHARQEVKRGAWVTCRPMTEFKAHAELNRRGFFAYLPLGKKKRRNPFGHRQAPSNKRHEWIDWPVFSGTVFFAIQHNWHDDWQWTKLRNPQVFTRVAQDPMTGRAARISAAEMAAYIGYNKERFDRWRAACTSVQGWRCGPDS